MNEAEILLRKVNEIVETERGGYVAAVHNAPSAIRPTRFASIDGPFSDGGSYALYRCNGCGREFSSGEGTKIDPFGKLCIQCPQCTTMDPSYEKVWGKVNNK